MEKIENILREYGRGDMQRRLHLYLEHRSLRRDFMEIDRNESPGPQKKKSGIFSFRHNFWPLHRLRPLRDCLWVRRHQAPEER